MWICPSGCDASTPKECKCKAAPSFEPVEKFDEDRGKYVEQMLPQGGMTLRDYFAAKAMGSMVDPHSVDDYAPEAARRAYVYADAMLAERSK